MAERDRMTPEQALFGIDEAKGNLELRRCQFEELGTERDWQIADLGGTHAHHLFERISLPEFRRDLQTSQKFVIHNDWGRLFKSFEGSDGTDFRAPYDDCLFEMCLGGFRTVTYLQTRPDEEPAIAAWVFFEDPAGVMTPYSLYFLVGDQWRSAKSVRPGAMGLIEAIALQIRAISVMLEVELAEAVSIDPSEKLNRARARRGRVPINEYKIVRLRAEHSRRGQSGRKPYQGVVKCHLRRGHWAKIRGHRIWRKWTIVGNPDLGFVDHDYWG